MAELELIDERYATIQAETSGGQDLELRAA
jgi:hypothetical protein